MGSAAEAARDTLTPLGDTPAYNAPVAARAPLKQRIDSVDLLRGLVMVIMLHIVQPPAPTSGPGGGRGGGGNLRTRSRNAW